VSLVALAAIFGLHWGDPLPVAERRLGPPLNRTATELGYERDVWGYHARLQLAFDGDGLDTLWVQVPLPSDAAIPEAYARLEATAEQRLQAPGTWTYHDFDTMASQPVKAWQVHAADVVAKRGYFGTDWFLAHEVATLVASHADDPPEHGETAATKRPMLVLVVGRYQPDAPVQERTIPDPFTPD
jgi:hypothetical protein